MVATVEAVFSVKGAMGEMAAGVFLVMAVMEAVAVMAL